jgi:hypothetical protein
MSCEVWWRGNLNANKVDLNRAGDHASVMRRHTVGMMLERVVEVLGMECNANFEVPIAP